MADWRLEGPYMKNCNCDPGCPCDFNANPTHGHCEGMAAMIVEHGHLDDVNLDGVKWAKLTSGPAKGKPPAKVSQVLEVGDVVYVEPIGNDQASASSASRRAWPARSSWRRLRQTARPRPASASRRLSRTVW